MRDLDQETPGPQGAAQPTVVMAGQPDDIVHPRHRGRLAIFLLIGLLVLIALLVGGFFIAERVFRESAENYVREKVVATFALPSDEGIDVHFGDGLLLPQAVSGTIDDVRVSVDAVTVGDFSGSTVLTARGVPLDPKKPAGHIDIQVGVTEQMLNSFIGGSQELGDSKVTLEDGSIRLSAEYALFGPKIAVDLAYTPGAADGELTFTPTEVKINGTTLSPDGGGPFGEAAAGMFAPQSYCLAAFLPEALALQSVSVHDERLELSIGGDGVVLGEDLATKGSCPNG